MRWNMVPVLLPVLFSCAHVNADVVFYKNSDGHVYDPIHTPARWAFDCVFPEVDKPMVREAIAYWDGLTSMELFTECSCEEANNFMVVFYVDDDYYKDQKGKFRKNTWGTANSATYGTFLMGAKVVFYKPWSKAGDAGARESVVRHEIGHALGFRHSTREDCLMHPTINTKSRSYAGVLKDACTPEIREFRRRYDVEHPAQKKEGISVR